MKPKKQKSGTNPADIRSFFSLSPGEPTATRSKRGKRTSGVSTPSTAAGTPPSPARSTANSTTNTGTPSSPCAVAEGSSAKRAAASTLTPGRAKRTPPLLLTPPPADVISLTSSPTSSAGSGSGEGIFDARARLASSPSAAAAVAASSLAGPNKNKENGAGGSRKASASPPLDTAPRQSPSTAAPVAPTVDSMSGYFLEGPAPPARNSGGSQGSGAGEGNWNLPSSRYALPLGEIVLGRDSVRDDNPANKNKLRIGIDKREEGVSRSQVKLQVCETGTRVLVSHIRGAINGIRILRWSGSAGLTAEQKAERQANAAAASKALRMGEVLQDGQQSYLYPGDTLQLDGFRAPSSSTCSYVLHPLPPGWTAPPVRSGSFTYQTGTSARVTPTKPAANQGGAAVVARDARAAEGPAAGSNYSSPVRGGPWGARGVSTPQRRKPSPAPVVAGGGGRRATTPNSTVHGAGSRVGGVGSTPTPSPMPLPASSPGKAREASGGREGKSPRGKAPASAAASLARATPATAAVSSSPANDQDTVQKMLQMSLAVGGRSGSSSGGGSASARGSSAAAFKTPPSTAGRLACPSPVEETPSRAAKRSHVAVAVEPQSSPRNVVTPCTPTRPTRPVAGGDSSASKRLKRSPTSGAPRGGVESTSVSPAAEAGTGGGGHGAAASAASAATAHISAEAAPEAVAGTAAAAESSRPPAPQVSITPRDRAARVNSADGGDGKAGKGGGKAGIAGASWNKGDFVVLKARTSKGVNKLGGVARVLDVFEDDTYLVKLSLGGKPTRVGSDLLVHYTPSPELASRGRRSTSRRRDSGGTREVDPSNGWIPSSSSSSSPSSSPTATSSRRVSKGRRGLSSDESGDNAASLVRSDERGGVSAPSLRTGMTTRGVAGVGAAASSVTAARPGDRARILYDDKDWYMGTVVTVHRDASVTVRFDDGSKLRVTLCPGDAETCPDDALAPAIASTGPPTPSSGRSRGGGGSCSRDTKSRGRVSNAVRTLGPGGRVLREGEGSVLTEERAKALLDTAPHKLVGLVYQEHHPGYGGWWETTVTEVSEELIGDDNGGGGSRDKDNCGMNKLWPESVVVGQMDRSGEKSPVASAVAAAAAGKDEPDFVFTRKTSAFLSRLRVWDKHREAEWEAMIETEGDGDPVAEPKSSLPKQSAKQDLPPPAASRSSARNAASKKKNAMPKDAANSGGGVASRKTVATTAPSAPTARKRKTPAKGAASRSGPVAVARHPVPPAAGKGAVSAEGAEEEEEGKKNKPSAARKAQASSKKQQAAFKKEAAEERALPTCPFCGGEFYVTETQDQVDRHLAACRPKATSAVIATSTPMPPSLSCSLVIGLEGEELGSLVAAVAEFAARGVRPTVAFCDRVMQAICNSKCRFQTEYLRRLMKSTLEAFPACWQPLNWSRFDEALQDLVLGQDNPALNARVAYLEIALDCIEASRRHSQQNRASDSGSSGGGGRTPREGVPAPGGVPPPLVLPQLFLGAGGDREGRAALRQCSKWAAKVWAQRHVVVTASRGGGGGGGDYNNEMNTRVCMTASRALGEALEAFRTAAGGWGAGGAPRELEGCQLAAVALDSYGEVTPPAAAAGKGKEAGEKEAAEATARCRSGLMRSLGGWPFCPTLAAVLLQSMPDEDGAKSGGVEVAKLKALLRRQQAPMGSPDGGEGEKGMKGVGGGRGRARATLVVSGSALLFADMDAESS